MKPMQQEDMEHGPRQVSPSPKQRKRGGERKGKVRGRERVERRMGERCSVGGRNPRALPPD